MQQTLHQFAVLLGYGPGPALAAHSPRGVLLADAATFLLFRRADPGRREGTPTSRPAAPRARLLVETADGFRYILRSPILRAIALVVLLLLTVTTVPEGLAAAWAGKMAHPIGGKGISQALIMASNPVGQVLGGFVINRLISPAQRARLLPVLAVVGPLALTPAFLHPNALVMGLCALASGVALAGVLPNAIGIFARVVMPDFRTRTFGVMQTGVQISQAIGVLATGALADTFDLPTVVGVRSLAGAGLVLLACLTWWPTPSQVADAVAARDTVTDRIPHQERVGPEDDQPDTGRAGAGQLRTDLSGATTIDG